jgi:hypothetical protein
MDGFNVVEIEGLVTSIFAQQIRRLLPKLDLSSQRDPSPRRRLAAWLIIANSQVTEPRFGLGKI